MQASAAGWHPGRRGAKIRPMPLAMFPGWLWHSVIIRTRRLIHTICFERTIIPRLAAFACENLRRTGRGSNVQILAADGGWGHPPGAPYDAISVAAAAPEIPAALLEQLAARTDSDRIDMTVRNFLITVSSSYRLNPQFAATIMPPEMVILLTR